MMMITSAFIPLLLCSGSVGGVPQDKELSNALVFGADAALNVYVHDEMNKPITGACVRCGFWLQTSKSSKAVYGQTDAAGHFLANLNDPNLESDIVKKNADRSEELQQW